METNVNNLLFYCMMDMTLYFFEGCVKCDENIQRWHTMNECLNVHFLSVTDIDNSVTDIENYSLPVSNIWENLTDKQRLDMSKYIIMFLYGGGYSDTRVCSSLNLMSLIQNKKCQVFLGTDIVLDSNEIDNDASISSSILKVCDFWFYTTVKHHPFWREVINNCCKHVKEDFQNILTRVYKSYSSSCHHTDICLMDYYFTKTNLTIIKKIK